MQDAQILLVSESAQLANSIQSTLVGALATCCLETVADIEAARMRIGRGDIRVVLAHLVEPQAEPQIAELLRAALNGPFPIPMIVLAEREDQDRRYRLLQQGAVDCLVRPLELSRLGCLLHLLANGSRYRQRDPSPPPVPASVPVSGPADNFLLASTAMRTMFERFAAVAPLDTTLLLTGETGTGKSHTARLIHELSPRKAQPFVAVGCAGLSATLLDSELFGHTRGAFTGADRDRAGKFTLAEQGTILLDEIDCVPAEAQGKLLGVLEQRVYEPLGSNRQHPVRARVIAASNQPLEDQVAAGRFRSDLYYRLNVVSFQLPPLRRSPEAVRPLVDKFLGVFCSRAQRPLCRLTTAALNALEAYRWPGNIRELRNTMEQAVALGRHDRIDLADLPEAIQKPAQGAPPAGGETVADGDPLAAARKHGELLKIMDTLRRHQNNRTKTAEVLGISRRAFYKKLHHHGLLSHSPDSGVAPTPADCVASSVA
jgi:DNA-binding NtrC family response regulator